MSHLDPLATEPLWLQLRNHPRLFCLQMHPSQLSVLLNELANLVEKRGDLKWDLDPGETADWLRNEAHIAASDAEEQQRFESSCNRSGGCQ